MLSAYIWNDFPVIMLLNHKKWKMLSSYYLFCYYFSSYCVIIVENMENKRKFTAN